MDQFKSLLESIKVMKKTQTTSKLKESYIRNDISKSEAKSEMSDYKVKDFYKFIDGFSEMSEDEQDKIYNKYSDADAIFDTKAKDELSKYVKNWNNLAIFSSYVAEDETESYTAAILSIAGSLGARDNKIAQFDAGKERDRGEPDFVIYEMDGVKIIEFNHNDEATDPDIWMDFDDSYKLYTKYKNKEIENLYDEEDDEYDDEYDDEEDDH